MPAVIGDAPEGGGDRDHGLHLGVAVLFEAGLEPRGLSLAVSKQVGQLREGDAVPAVDAPPERGQGETAFERPEEPAAFDRDLNPERARTSATERQAGFDRHRIATSPGASGRNSLPWATFQSPAFAMASRTPVDEGADVGGAESP